LKTGGLSDGAGRQTVLVVDDSADNLDVLAAALRDHFAVRVATSGEQALKAVLHKPKPAVILLDIMMPGMDGYEVCKHLKARAVTADIPVIFLTGKGAVEDAQRGFEVGAVDYITKPILPPVVLARVKAHASAKRTQDYIGGQSGM
jgi:putative two-component system response regulator